MTAQLTLFEMANREEFRGSKPVPNRLEPVQSVEARNAPAQGLPRSVPTGSGTDPVPVLSACDHNRFSEHLSKEREKSPEPITDQTLLQGREEIANASLSPCGQRGRDVVPLLCGARAVSDSGTGPEPVRNQSGTSPEPQPSQQAAISPIESRPYQVESIAAVEAERTAGRKSTLLVLPTGCGKTVVGAALISGWAKDGAKTLVLAHREELLGQWHQKLLAVDVDARLEQGSNRAGFADVVLASVATLQRKRLDAYPPDYFARIVTDEAHHAPAKSYRNVYGRFTAAFHLGVTATPDRGDGRGLRKVYQSVAYTYDMRRAIREKYLAPLKAKRIEVDEMNLDRVDTHHGDFDQAGLSAVMNEEKNLIGTVEPIMREAESRRTLVFAVDVAHARAIAEMMNARRPGCAIAIDGTTKSDERAAVLSLYRRGVFQFLVNCALFTEGFDEPSIECVAICRPTQSRALYTQMIGRGTRKFPGKLFCLILDLVGNSGRHRLVGPADALAGHDLDEATKKLVEANEDGDLGLDEILAKAEEAAALAEARRRAKHNTLALQTYRSREIDVFLGDQIIPFDVNCAAALRPATAEQLLAIKLAKLGDPPAGICEAEAAALLTAVETRRRAGLCTIPQARLLERSGCDTKTMTKGRAGELISRIVQASEKAENSARARGGNEEQIKAAKNAVWRRPFVVIGHEPEFRKGKFS